MRVALNAIAGAMLFAFAAHASALASEPVILTIDGKTAQGTALDFTRTDLEKLGLEQVTTSTPWHDGVQTFEGVNLDKLMKNVGAAGEKVFVAALNDYATEIPLSDFTAYHVILALKRNGAYMGVGDKGPLFVIYPLDEHTELRNELYYSRSAWQVRSMKVE
jgi:hypothetical protein